MTKPRLPALLLLPALALLSGCYTDSAGRVRFGRAPAGPTPEQREIMALKSRLSQVEASSQRHESEIGGLGSSIYDVSSRSDELSRSTDARGQDVARLRADVAALQSEVDSLRAQLAKVPTAISAATAAERQTIVAEVNKAIAASESRTDKAIREAVRQASRTPGGGGGGSRPAGPAHAGEFYEYTVQSGQTLSEIASAFGCTVAEIIRENGIKDAANYSMGEGGALLIKDAAKIRVGQVLYIPKH